MSVCLNPRCRKPFSPCRRWLKRSRPQQYCSQKCYHAMRWGQKWAHTSAAVAARKDQARRQLAAIFQREFGPLSTREFALVRRALKIGRDRQRHTSERWEQAS